MYKYLPEWMGGGGSFLQIVFDMGIQPLNVIQFLILESGIEGWKYSIKGLSHGDWRKRNARKKNSRIIASALLNMCLHMPDVAG